MSADPNVLEEAASLPFLETAIQAEDVEEAAEFYAEPAGWSETEEVFRSSTPLRSLNLGISSDGRVYALWTSDNWLWFTRRVADGWGQPETLFRGIQPHLVVDAQGDAHLVFVKEFDRRFQVYYSRYAEPGWMLPYDISRTRGLSQHPKVAISPEEGLVYVVWEDDTPGFPSLYYAYNPEGQWINGPVPGARGWRPAMAFDGTGVLHLVWASAIPRGRGDDIFHAQVTSHGWTLAENISDSPRTDSAFPAIAGGPDNQVHVLWEERVQRRSLVGYSAGKYAFWSRPVALTPSGPAHSPSLVVTPQGEVHAIWEARGILGYRFRSAGEKGVWHTPQALDRTMERVDESIIACDHAGNVHVLWTRQVDDRWLLFYRHRQQPEQRKTYIPEAVG